ncbi:MAG: HigA family addiction module antitoxin [Pseudomonadota bacterium]
MTAPPKRSSVRCPTHPGAILREIVLPALPQPKTEVARALGISRQSLYDILAEKQPVTPAMAVRLGAVLGTSAASWLNMQTAYDLWHAERQVDTTALTPLKVAS